MAESGGGSSLKAKESIRVKYSLNGCYSFMIENDNDNLNTIKTHPILANILIDSPLAAMVYKAREKKELPQIFFHLRRGDISQIELSLVKDLLIDKSMVDKIAHLKGIFTKEEAAHVIPLNHKNNYSTVTRALEVLKRHVAELSPNCTVILASDGFTRLADRLISEHAELFISGTSKEVLEIALLKEIFPLVQVSDIQFIGESDDFLVQTLINALASDRIISSRLNMFRHLTNALCRKKILYLYVDLS